MSFTVYYFEPKVLNFFFLLQLIYEISLRLHNITNYYKFLKKVKKKL